MLGTFTHYVKNRIMTDSLIAGTLTRIDPDVSLIRLTWSHGEKPRFKGKSQCVLCLDRSGSMSGAAWTRVQQCVTKFLGNVRDMNSDVEVIILMYNDSCENLRGDHLDQFRSAPATNRTDFSNVFRELKVLIQALGRGDCMRVCFFTDGDDTVSLQNRDDCLMSLQRAVIVSEAHVVVDVMAFRTTDNRTFLERVRNSGSTPGIYQFCTSVDDMGAMLILVTELFGTTRTQALNMGPVRIIADETLPPLEVVGTTSSDEPPNTVTVGEDGRALVEFFVATPPVNFQLFRAEVNGQAIIISELPPEQLSVYDMYDSRVIYAERLLFKACGKGTQLTRNDTQQLQDLIKFCASALSERRLTKEQRTEMLTRRQELQTRLDDLHVLVEDKARRNHDEVLSRMANLRYVGVIDSARRRRQLAQRAADNAARDSDFDAKLRALTYDPQALPQDLVSQAFFQCTIGMAELDEIMGDAHGGVLGFGLAVTRPETVVDAPTMIRIQQVSNTLLTRQSLLDAIAYNVDVTGKLRCSYNEKEAVGETVGRSREPINAWLPLYVCRDHWARARILLRPTLGYFCCMDPLAFQEYQYDVMLMVLGTMAARSAQNFSERDQQLFLAFRDTCRQLFSENDKLMEERVLQPLRQFVESPEHRLKHYLNNLLVTVGQLFVAPRELVTELVEAHKFFLLLLQETARRACGDLLCGQPPAVGLELLFHMLYDADPTDFDPAEFTLLARSSTQDGSDATDAATFKVQIDVTDVTLDTALKSSDVRQLSLCGKAVCDTVPGPKIEEKKRSAEDFYQKWRQGHVDRAHAIVSERATLRGADTVTVNVHTAMQSLMSKITPRMYPNIPQLAAIRNLLDHFHANYDDDGVVEGARPLAPGAVSAVALDYDPRLVRAILVQGVACASNSDARASATKGEFVDPNADDFIERVTQLHAGKIQQRFAESVDATVHSLLKHLFVSLMVETRDIHLFIQLLANEIKQRNQWFHMLVSRAGDMALAAEKVEVMMTGRYEDKVVFCYGNRWQPESRQQREELSEALGDDVYMNLVTQINSQIQTHVYRSSGIPNRHGSSNAHPHDYLHCPDCIANKQMGGLRIY